MKIFFLLIFFLTFFICPLRSNDWDWEYDLWVKELSRQHDVCPRLVLAVIDVESNFRHSSVSPAGAVGFMQLMPSTARMLGIFDPHDPIENLKGGIKYLGILKKQFERNIPMVLAAYNAGPTAVRRYGTIPPFKETHNFVFRVLNRYEYYMREGSGSTIFQITP